MLLQLVLFLFLEFPQTGRDLCEQYAVEMIDLVLEDARHPAVQL